MADLEPRQRAFVNEYVIDFNGAQAAMRAGYAVGAARVQASQLLTRPNIQAAVREAVEKRNRRNEATADRVVQELCRLGYAQLRRLFSQDGTLLAPSEWDEETQAAVSSIEVEELFEGEGEDRKLIGYTKKVKLWDKNRALDVLAKHTGVYREGLNVFINIINSPQWVELRTVLVAALEPHPKALASVMAALEAHAGPDGDG